VSSPGATPAAEGHRHFRAIHALDRYSDFNGHFVLLDALSCGFEADGANESIKIVDDALIEAIELRSL
jgi:hypothetical protein